MTLRSGIRVLIVLVTFAVVFIALDVASFTRTSATWDEPPHLTAGYLALKTGDCRLDPEHPPFIRLWAALPLLARHIPELNAHIIDGINPLEWVASEQFQYAHVFLYKTNDADTLLYTSRFMIVLLGVLLGILLFFWVLEWLGFFWAVIALGCYTIEPNILAHSSLVTTDFGIACFLFGSVYFLWRTTRCLGIGNLVGFAAFSALSVVSKFAAVLLGPIVVLLLAVRVGRSTPWACRIGQLREIRTRLGRTAAAVAALFLVGFTCWGVIWATYGFRYLPSSTPGWRYDFEEDAVLRAFGKDASDARPLRIEGMVRWIDAHHLLPNAYSEGFLLGQIKAGSHASYIAGKISRHGCWYYFPVAFLIKTPTSLVVLSLGGLLVCAMRQKEFLPNSLFVFLPVCICLAAAMSFNLNIGLRHVLTIYPFTIMLATLCAAEFIRTQQKMAIVVLSVLYIFWLFEFARAYPHNLAFFNQFVGGPRNGDKYLVDSNIDWGQELKGLKRWMDEHNVRHINLSYFGTADPAYYNMDCTYLPGSPSFDATLVTDPVLPGYVAVSVTNLRVLFSQEKRELFKPLLDMKPAAVIGYSIRVYWVEPGRLNPALWSTLRARAHCNLANALLGQGKTTEAVAQYQEALRINPNFVDAHFDLGNALRQAGEFEEAVRQYQQVLEIDPEYAEAYGNWGYALARLGRMSEAIGQYEKALKINPKIAEVHYNFANALVRVRKVQEAIGQYDQALRIKPDLVEAQNNLAWLLATLPPAEGGDPVRAVGLAQQACGLSGNRVPGDLDTLAVAYAAAGRFDAAVATAQKAIDLARSAGQAKLVEEIEARLELYRSKRAFRPSTGTVSPGNP
ncbi:MAG: tetratricopeptide repeat protein [Verrucomicrobiia bacterium]